MKTGKYIALFCFLLLMGQTTQAQGIIGVAERKVNLLLKGDAITFDYLEVRDTQAFRQLMQRLNNPSNYPLSIVKKPVFDPLLKLVEDYDAQLNEYKQLDKQHDVIDGINQEKIHQLVKLDSIQNKRIENFKNLTDEMRATNAQLNEQLTRSLADLKKCNDGKVRKHIWTGVLGGAVGFSVATLIALLAR
ncbi:MAG: hypothetical protein JNL70_06470 [Saprospiraceae bacterium]|nr:hypothetical protein [Saprospiraceae bacterium]